MAVRARRLALWAILGFGGGRVAAQLVQIDVEIVEVDESRARKAGLKWNETLSAQEGPGGKILRPGPIGRVDPLRAELALLAEKGAAELLARPKLLTEEGHTASFRAGGELPYISAGGLGTSRVEFKSYGVGLEATPRLGPDRSIDLSLRAEISSPDPATSVSLSGNSVPGILSRTAVTRVILLPGQTLTIAGLLQTRRDKTRSGFPLLSDLPGLGLLFSRQTWSYRKTSVLIFVTPSLPSP